jgi:hypothetical protein
MAGWCTDGLDRFLRDVPPDTVDDVAIEPGAVFHRSASIIKGSTGLWLIYVGDETLVTVDETVTVRMSTDTIRNELAHGCMRPLDVEHGDFPSRYSHRIDELVDRHGPRSL